MNKFATASATAYIACTFALAAPFSASAQDFDMYIGRDGPRYYDDDNRGPPMRDRDGYRDGYRARPEAYQCTPRQALNKARRYLRNPRVGRTSNDAIEIVGYGSRGERNRVVFGGERGCPRIG